MVLPAAATIELAFPDLLDALDVDLARTSTVPCPRTAHGGVLGAVLLAQQVVLAERLVPGKQVQVLSASFLRRGDDRHELDVHADVVREGRRFASVVLTFLQDGAPVARTDVLLGADAGTCPATGPALVPPPSAWPITLPLLSWETLETGAGDDVELWSRIPDAPDDPMLWRALAAGATEVPTMERFVRTAARPLAVSVLSMQVSLPSTTDVRDWHVQRGGVAFADGSRVLARTEVSGAGGLAASAELWALATDASR